jgi:hypothetical protein
LFDSIFLFQHFVLYRGSHAKKKLEDFEIEQDNKRGILDE